MYPAHLTTRGGAVELRDSSWLHDETFAALRRHGAALCLHDLLAEWLDTGRDVYAYFNNDYQGNAVLDAPWLAQALTPPGRRRHGA